MEIIDQTAKVVMLKGEGGDTIKSIDKTTTQGLVDIYTITLESGNKTTFNVTNGNGIKTIEKTSTSGLIDTYTVTFDNGETTTFTVTNGEKGEKGDKGDTGPQGPQGPKGEKGDPGDGGGIANVDTELSTTSTNPVQNKAIAEGINSILSQIVPTASIESGANASKAYSVGDFLVKDGTLYKATKAIAKDYALTVGDNIASETIAEGLNSIQSQIVPTASIEVGETASKAYSDDDYLVKDGILYKVTTDIAKDDALTVGTNIVMTTVGGELSSINERLLRYKTIRFSYYYSEKGKVVKLKLRDIVKDLGTYAFVDGSTYLLMTDALGYYINLPIGCTTKSGGGYASCYIEFATDGFINSANICFYSGSLEGEFYVILHYLPIE